jgi:RND family efflux transporter MFP subunit
LPQGFISKAVYDVRKNEVDAAVAALDTAEAQLRQAANAVGYAVLVADKPGIVTAVAAEPGQVLSTGQAVITLAVSGETEIMIAVPEQDAGHLSVGQQAKVSLWSGPRENIAGRIREIAGQADAASRTYAVRVAVSAPPQMMRLGMTATVKFSVSEGTTAIVVPLAAVTEIGGSRVVFVVDRASKVVHATPITVSGVAADGVRIVGGLEAGDIVVSAGVQFLRDGMRVRLAAAPNS